MMRERLLNVLLGPHVSEKTARVGEAHRQYGFKVMTDATKGEIKKAVEGIFKVSVEAVTVSNVKGKSRRQGKIIGRRKAWKKAYVKLCEGHEIDFSGSQA